MKKYLIILISFIAMTSCTQKAPKALILYYSQTGSTKAVAEEVQKQTGADIASFDVEEVYDGDFDATIKRCLEERQNGFVPTLAPLDCKLSDYDVIYLGYPIWFGTYAPPVKALLAGADLSGKKIVPFCTFGSGGLYSSIEDLKKELPESEIADGFGIRQARLQYAEEELNRFLIENGYKEGSIDPLPEYSEQDVVIPEEMAIYEEAVAGYPYQMGTPVSVGSRSVPGGVDFLYIVEGQGPDGTPVTGKVYVSRRNGRKTEFTQMVR